MYLSSKELHNEGNLVWLAYRKTSIDVVQSMSNKYDHMKLLEINAVFIRLAPPIIITILRVWYVWNVSLITGGKHWVATTYHKTF